MDYGDVAEAVTAAVPRVRSAENFKRSVNGFGHQFKLRLNVDSTEPFTDEEVDALVEAIWVSLPWEPNAIAITAGADTAQGSEPVDLRAAADHLTPLSVTDEGTGGAGFTGMADRYGAWTASE